MTSKSKNKGNSFEREVAKYLSDMYSEPFNRVVNSGAYVGGKNSIRKEKLSEGQIRSHKGDIVPPDSWKKFNAEAKSYAEFPFHRLLMNVEIPLLETWIGQSLDAADDGDFTVIFMKFNRIGRYIAYDPSFDLKCNRYVDYTSPKYGTWRITYFDEFLELNRDEIKKICES